MISTIRDTTGDAMWMPLSLYAPVRLQSSAKKSKHGERMKDILGDENGRGFRCYGIPGIDVKVSASRKIPGAETEYTLKLKTSTSFRSI